MKYDILKNLVYILQSEHYNRKRFLTFSYKNFFKLFTISKRGDLDWTKRAKEEYFLSLFLIFLDIFIIFYFNLPPALLILVFIFLPVYVFVADLFISPYIEFKKNKIRKEAKVILKNSKIKVIGITGSYGKTTAKNILESILSEKFKVLKTLGNINTDMGVSNFIIEKEKELDNYDFLILEMGAYRTGDIKMLCDISKPKYSITTAVGKSHLERFGSQENIIKAKFELSQNTSKRSFLNTCDKNISENIENFLKDEKNIFSICAFDKVKNIEYLDNFSGLSFEFEKKTFETKLLAKHNITTFVLAIELAKELKMSFSEIKKGILKLENIDHRLFVIENKQTGVIVIDDSYNGNYDGFVSGIEILKNAKGRKIVLTPGIVELSKEERVEAHKKIAKKYIKNIDLILLVKNENTKIIEDYFKKNNFNSYKVYNSAEDAHKNLGAVLKKGDTIIFQNDLPDNYN